MWYYKGITGDGQKEGRGMDVRWREWLRWDSVTLCGICLADMLSSLYWVHTSAATEMNPWMAHWLQHGDWAFCAMKLLSFLPLVAVAAYYRPRRPRLIAIAMRGTIALYVVLYLYGVGMQFMTA